MLVCVQRRPNISVYLNGVSKYDRTKQNENIPLSSIDFKWFLMQVWTKRDGRGAQGTREGGGWKEFLVAVSRAPHVLRACLRSSKKSEKLTFLLQARLQVAYLP